MSDFSLAAEKTERTRFNEPTNSETRLLGPVVGTWLVVFTIAVFGHTSFVEFNSDSNFNRMAEWAEDTLALFVMTHSAVGIFMTIAWICFFNSITPRRIFGGVATVVATAILGLLIAIPQFHGASARHWAPFIFLPALMVLIGLGPVWSLRRFSGWRIHYPNDTNATVTRQFGMSDLFKWTGLLAVLMTISRVAFRESQMESSEILEFLIAGIGVPLIVGCCLLSLLGRWKIRWMFIVVPALSIFGGFALAIVFLVLRDINWNYVSREVMWPAITWFTVGGFALTAVAAYLRYNGLVLAFGELSIQRGCQRDLVPIPEHPPALRPDIRQVRDSVRYAQKAQ